MSFIYFRPYLSVVENNRCPISIYSRFFIALFVLGIGLSASVLIKEFSKNNVVPAQLDVDKTSASVEGCLESFPRDFEFNQTELTGLEFASSYQADQKPQLIRYTVGKKAAELSDCSMSQTYPGASTMPEIDERPTLPLDYHSMSEEELLQHGYIRHITINGDRLDKLAKRFLNDENRWEDIYKANKNQLTNQAVVPIGIVLIIPKE